MAVIARPPLDLGTSLPDGWEWWHPNGGLVPVRLRSGAEPPKRISIRFLDETVQEVGPRYWTRRLHTDHLHAWAEWVVKNWLATSNGEPVDNDYTSNAVNELPPQWRTSAMTVLGYGYRASKTLTGENIWEFTVPDSPEPPPVHSWEPSGTPKWTHGTHVVPVEAVPLIDPDRETDATTWYTTRQSRGTWTKHALGEQWEWTERIARAADGTPVPDGWEPDTDIEDDSCTPWLHLQLARHAPLGIGFRKAWQMWEETGSTRLTHIMIRPNTEGGWLLWHGVGGAAVQFGGRHNDADAALAAAMKQLEEQRAAHAWAEPVSGRTLPEIEVHRVQPGHSMWQTVEQNRVDPVGIKEIEQRLVGVNRNQLGVMRSRGQLPKEDWTIGGRPAWNWSTIRDWANAKNIPLATDTTE